MIYIIYLKFHVYSLSANYLEKYIENLFKENVGIFAKNSPLSNSNIFQYLNGCAFFIYCFLQF